MTNLKRNTFLCMFISILYTFGAFKCSSSGDSILSIRYLVYVTPSGTLVWTFRPNLHTRRSSTQNDIYQIPYWYNWISWLWALECSKRVENWNKHIQKIIVCQFVIKQNYLDIPCNGLGPLIHEATLQANNNWGVGVIRTRFEEEMRC